MKYFTTFLIFLLFTAQTFAAMIVSVTDGEFGDTGMANGQSSFSVSFDVTASSTSNSLVGIFIGFQDHKVSDISNLSAKLNSNSMTEGIALTNGGSGDVLGAFYYLAPTVVGTNSISVTASSSKTGKGMTVQAYILDNVNTGVAPQTAANFGDGDKNPPDPTILTLTPTADGSAVLGYGVNENSTGASSDYFDNLVINNNGEYGFTGFKTDVGATEQTIDFDPSGRTYGENVGLAVSFAPVPEPSAGLLLISTLAVFAAFRRRNR